MESSTDKKRRQYGTHRAVLMGLLVYVGFMSTLSAEAQVTPYFRHITEEAGLAERSVLSMLQDQKGYLWFGTLGGLYRYDGINLVAYWGIPGDSTSLPNNIIHSLYESSDGTVWVGTAQGLATYNEENDAFTRVAPEFMNLVSDIQEDRSGALWVATFNNGLYRFDLATERYDRFVPDQPADLPAHHWVVNSITVDETGTMWVASLSGLYQWRPETETLERHISTAPAEWGGGPDHILDVLEDPVQNGILWLMEARGVSRYEPSTRTYSPFFSYPMDTYSSDATWWSMPQAGVFDPVNPGALWTVNPVTGLFRIDTSTGTHQRFANYGQTPSALLDAPEAIYRDKTGLVWVATASGISRFDPGIAPFSVVNQTGGLQASDVTGVTQDTQGRFWITTGDHVLHPALTVWDPEADTMRHWYDSLFYEMDVPESERTVDFGTSIFALHQDPNGFLWIGSNTNGLTRFDPEEQTFTNYPYNKKAPESLSSKTVQAMVTDQEGALWIGTVHGLNRLPQGAQGFDYFYGAPNGLHTSDIQALYEDTSGRLWVGTDGGLSYRDPITNTFTQVYPLDTESYAPGAESIRSFRQSEVTPGILWAGTDAGLLRIDVARATVTHVGEGVGIPKAPVAALLEDNQGYIWGSTQGAGLFRYRPETGIVQRFGREYNIKSKVFSWNAAYKDPEGVLHFGGRSGLISVDPEKITANKIPPAVYITEVTLFGVPLQEYGHAIRDRSGTRAFQLDHEQHSLGFEFVALDYADPTRNHYAYRLIGAQEEWVLHGTQRSITFPRLDPGTYEFQVKAASSMGLWNDAEPASFRFVIAPPWWKTFWAYIGYGVILVGGVTGLYRWQRRRILAEEQRRASIQEAHLRAELSEEKNHYLEAMDKVRSRFFANISHEFRTPLTLLMSPLEEVYRGEKPDTWLMQHVPSMHRNAGRLVRLVNQLLDLARIEAGSMRLQLQAFDLVHYLKELTLSFSPLAERDGITLLFDTSLSELRVELDKDKLEKIVTNLLSNAFKFTMRGGKVRMALQTEEQKEGLMLTVSDTGIGIAEEQLPHIFDRFYQVDDASTRSSEGTGIGLALVKELIELLQGGIRVESQRGFGTTFTIQLPLALHGQVHADAEEQMETSLSASKLELMALQTPNEADQSGATTNGVTREGTVLIVDDNQDIRTLIAGHLSPHFTVLEASDGVAGLGLIREALPDLVISDVMMPEMDGNALCRTLKEDPTLRHIPVILLTAKAEEEHKLRGLAGGADDYLTKPFSLRELEVRVTNLVLSRKQLRDHFTGMLRVESTDIVIPSEENAFMGRVLDAMQERLSDSQFNTDWLANELSMSRRQLERKVKAITRKTPAELMRGLRLERAARILEARPGSIAEVAYAVGFKSPAHFSAAFKKSFGYTPSEHIDKAS